MRVRTGEQIRRPAAEQSQHSGDAGDTRRGGNFGSGQHIPAPEGGDRPGRFAGRDDLTSITLAQLDPKPAVPASGASRAAALDDFLDFLESKGVDVDSARDRRSETPFGRRIAHPSLTHPARRDLPVERPAGQPAIISSWVFSGLTGWDRGPMGAALTGLGEVATLRGGLEDAEF